MRLICFPHGGGGPQAYRAWAEELPAWIEVVAIAPPGRGARWREEAIRDISTIRTSIADALGEITTAPYAFFGHSVGALVAFEVARELERRNAPSPLRVFLSAYAAPGCSATTDELRVSLFDDEALLAYLGRLGHHAADALADEDFRKLMLNAVRADFEIAETFRVGPSATLNTPLTALGGGDDPAVPQDGLEAWRLHARGEFTRAVFPGGHFYTESARNDLRPYLADTLQADLERLPKSLLYGAREIYPREACLHELFRQQAAKTPHAIALLDPGSATASRLTFAELDLHSDLLAQRFLALGCGPGKTIAIFMEPRTEYVVAYLAALKAGGAYLPIPVATPEAALAEILQAAKPAAVATHEALRSRLPDDWQDPERCIRMDKGWADRIAQFDLIDLENAPAAAPTDPAYVVMTSGTTGRPKGIVCPHRGAVNSYWWRYRHLPYGDGEREACNVFFVWEVLRPLLQGKPAVIIPDDVIFDPRRLVDFLERQRVTRVLFTPSLIDTLLTNSSPDLARRLKALRTVILNGEVVTTALAARFADALPHASLVNDYSISECHDVATIEIGQDVVAHLGQRPYLPVGGPMSNVNIYVLDDAHEPVPTGVSGEIYVGGDSIACGYLDAPERTADRFLADPFARKRTGDQERPRMFRTGDVGRVLPGGELEIGGRAHFMVKLRGYSVVPAAIEAELRAYPWCAVASVVCVDDEKTGQPDHLVAYVVSGQPSGALDKVALRAHLKTRLPQYAIPREIVELPALPIDPATGKIDRRKLPAPQTDRNHAIDNGMRRDDFTNRLAVLWRRVLRVKTVGPDDNFFDLGGHSLLAAEMTHSVAEELSVVADVIDVFDKPVFGDYAAHLKAKCGGSLSRRVEKPTIASPPQRRHGGPADIAVIGMAGRFPDAPSVDALWQLVSEGRSAIRRFDDDELRRRGVPQNLIDNPAYVKAGAILDDVADFDPRFWGLSEAEATVMDPQQRLFLECCWHALENSGHRPDDAGGNIGVFAGCYLPGYLIHHLGAAGNLDGSNPAKFHLAEIGNDKDYLASRVAYLMNLTGPAISVQTSCSTGLVAIAEAAAGLRAGRCDMALAGASSITFPQGGFVSAEGHVGSGSGACRAFDASADGTILGDGVGVVVLRRLEDALADGDEVLAVIKGHAVNNDGAAKAGYSAPSPSGQAAVIKSALRLAEVDPASVGYIEAHGTGTRLGDPIEVRGLTEAYAGGGERTAECALGSIKPNIGHANIAAGVAGFIKAVLAVRHGIIPPLAGFERENPELQLSASPFFVPREPQAWKAKASHPRRAGISSFGIGGTNCHMVIEQAPAPTAASAGEAKQLQQYILPVSAKTEQALSELAMSLVQHLRTHPEQALADIAGTLQSGRMEFEHRRAVVAATHDAAATAIEQCFATATAPTPVIATGKDAKLQKTAQHWEEGGNVDWNALREDRPLRRAALPGYPFARIRCWPENDVALPGNAAPTPERETRQPWQQMLYLPSWGRAVAPAMGGEPWQGTCFLLTPSEPPAVDLAENLAAMLSGPLLRIESLRISSSTQPRERVIPEVLKRMSECRGDVRIIDLSAFGADPMSAKEAVAATFDLTAFLTALSRRTVERHLHYWLIGDAMLKVQDEATRPRLAPLIGPLLAASQEHPRLQARLIDVRREGDSDHLAQAIAAELCAPTPRPEPLLAIRGRHRWVERFEPLPVDEGHRAAVIDRLASAHGPHVITGGMGRIGITLAKRLVASGGHVVLLSRRRPDDEHALRLAEFGNDADRISTLSCDVAEADELTAILTRIARSAGGLGGIFHAAGVADLKYIEETTSASIEAECAAKIAGTRNLRSAIASLEAGGAPLPQFVLSFSSLASVLGGLGMTGYAAANRYLDAEAAEAPDVCGVPFIAVNFDDWEFDYGKEQVGAFDHTRKGLSIPPGDGIALIETLLGLSGLERVVISATPLEQRVAKWGRLPAIDTIGGQDVERKNQNSPGALTEVADKDGRGGTLAIVLMAYAKVIGSGDLAPDSNFFELGGDSLLAAQLAMELRSALPGSDAGIGEIFDLPTPRLLAGHIQEQPTGSTPEGSHLTDGDRPRARTA